LGRRRNIGACTRIDTKKEKKQVAGVKKCSRPRDQQKKELETMAKRYVQTNKETVGGFTGGLRRGREEL